MPTPRLSPREETAYHEASHTVVGWLLGWRVCSITIDLEGSTKGYTAFNEPRPPKGEQDVLGIYQLRISSEDDLPDLLTRQYAGVVGQRIIRERRSLSVNPVRLGGDIREAREWVRDFDKVTRLAMLAAAEQRAYTLLSVDTYWSSAEELARYLLVHPYTFVGQALPMALSRLPFGAARQ